MGFPSRHTVIDRLAVAVAVLGLLGSCSQETGSLLVPQPDPEMNTAAEVAERLATLEVVLDAVGGFDAVDEQQTSAGDFLTQDVDADAELELLVHLDVRGRRDLPRIWLSPGSNANKEIAVTMRGFDTQDLVAAHGGTPPRKLFADDQLVEVRVPFNLVRRHRKPTVVAVTPVALPDGIYLGSVGFFASAPLDESSLPGHVTLSLAAGVEPEVNLTGSLTGPRSCPFETEMWIFTPEQCHRLGTGNCSLRLTIDPQVSDDQGRQITGPDGQPGFEKILDCSGIAGLGACPPAKNCSGADIGASTDLTCDEQGGLVQVSPCSIGPGGCENPSEAFDWLLAESQASCQSYRPDSLMAGGACVVENPWPCRRDQDCLGIGPVTCDTVSELCTPEPCQAQCSGDVWQCVPEQGCLPRLGGCSDDCGVFGSCPELSQTCTLLENGMRVCR